MSEPRIDLGHGLEASWDRHLLVIERSGLRWLVSDYKWCTPPIDLGVAISARLTVKGWGAQVRLAGREISMHTPGMA